MPSYPQGLPDNVNYLQQQILRSGTARLGPVSLKPGEGHIRMNDGTNDTGLLDFNGIQLRYRGGLRGLTALTEDFANLMESHTQTLATNIGRLNGHDADVARIDAKDAAQDQSLALKAWTSYVDSQNSAQNTRMNGMDSATAAAQSRANAAYDLAEGRATVASVTTAQNRANAAYTLAEGRASKAQLNDMIIALNSRLVAMQIWFAAASNGDTPANPPNIPGLPTVPQ